MELDRHHEPIATLHEGGAGLGRDVHEADTAEFNQWHICRDALRENAALRESVTVMGDEVAGLSKRCQWLTIGLLLAFGFGVAFALGVLA